MNRLLLLVILLVTLAVTVIRTDRCPQKCSCKIVPRSPDQLDYFYTSVQCRRTLNATERLPENVNKFVLSDAKVNITDTLRNLRVRLNAAQYLTEIYFKNLSVLDSSPPSIQVSALDRIRLFVLSACAPVARVPILGGLTSLKSLHLVGNSLRVIPARAFANVPGLDELNLSANELSVVELGAFDGLPQLRCLDLSANNLTELSGGVFASLQSLQHLNLSNNYLSALREDSFDKLVGLQQLDISWNRLVSVPPGSLELPHLSRLLLIGNMHLGGGNGTNRLLVGNGRQLQTIDASYTGLKQVPIALTHSIRTLKLTGNSINAINSGDMDSYPLLQLLDLTGNSIVTVEDDALGRLDYLSVLYLRENKLITVPKSLPVQLKILHLEFNTIKQIMPQDLLGLSQLEVLLLNDNNITTVHENVFADLSNLETLDISDNPIKTLGIISGPRELRVLRLAQLNALLSAAKETAFPLSVPEYLITLDLDGSIYLAKQLLADTAVLAAARQLQELNLAHTGVDTVRSDLLHYLSQLRTLHLDGNPLNCTELQWLAEWMRRQEGEGYRRVQCASPPEMKGSLLVDLQYIQEVVVTTSTATSTTTTLTATTTPKNKSINLTSSSEIIETAYPRNKFNNNSMPRSTAVAPSDKSARVDAEEAIYRLEKNNISKVGTNYISNNRTLDVDKTTDHTNSIYKLTTATTIDTERTVNNKIKDSPEHRTETATNQTASTRLKYETQSQNDILKLPQQEQQQQHQITESASKQRRRKVVNKQTQSTDSSKLAAPLPALRLSYVSNYQDGVGGPAALLSGGSSSSSASHQAHVTASNEDHPTPSKANFADNDTDSSYYAHPSMLIVMLVVAVATVLAILAIITTRTRIHQHQQRRRRRRRTSSGSCGSFSDGQSRSVAATTQFEEIEVANLPSVTGQLW